MEHEPSMYIGKQPFYIEFVGVDKANSQEKLPICKTVDKTNIGRRTDEYMRYFGFCRTSNSNPNPFGK